MKTVFTNSEVAHIWANASQDYARAKAVKVMSGYKSAQPLFREFWETYDDHVGSVAIDILILADEELPF